LKPASRSNCAATIGCAFSVVTSLGAMIATGVPSWPLSASSFFASAMPLPFTRVSAPTSISSGVFRMLGTRANPLRVPPLFPTLIARK